MHFFKSLIVGGASIWTAASAVASTKPNILFILTDDQDWHMESIQHMPLLQKYILNEGTLYSNHFCTVALCCPSRVTLWTGRAAHNTNVTDVFPPYGGWPKILREGINDDYLPLWMQNAGYNTYYTGKLWNHHHIDNYDKPRARGFNGSDFLLDPYTYEYYHSRMSRNNERPVSYEGQYSPDVIAQKAYGFLNEAMQHKEPWMLTVAPVASHGNVRLEGGWEISAPRYAKRHEHLFKDYKIPRDKNFNPEKQGGVSWVKNLPLLNDTVVAYNDEYQRARLRSLQPVDEMIENLVKMLEAKGVLDNTYIFYTTDNGYHISQHRLHPGKECGYDTDIHIPLAVRGPGVAAGRVTKAVTSHTDLSPTILQLAGQSREDFDGRPIPLSADETAQDTSNWEHVNIEFWGRAVPEGTMGKYTDDYNPEWGFEGAIRNNTYKGLRLIGDGYSLYYSVHCTGEHEFYDSINDPGQLVNLFDDRDVSAAYSLRGRPFDEIIHRLDALMMVLKSCKSESCLKPWDALHSSGNVATLKDALHPDFDAFYKAQPKVAFTSCELGYIREAEGPQDANVLGSAATRLELREQQASGQSFGYKGHWSHWT
ncbi:uncharacterized protein PV06_01006 [Exophiala oligosperma]|uniref:Arylsulfatase n=1 Tax=Exophiala oligosperma TaxID=215243 RepID=A0A0D2E0W0_9EURO|nr:uncharacterized protein PV06_01006 [Exophiala oligosperma]KIW48420.1 hypothetical protein PV06_01006 [Exophiala oligosperma]